MGTPDNQTYLYCKDTRHFADIANFMFFRGEQVIRHDRLKAIDTREVFVDSNGAALAPRNRDLLMEATLADGSTQLICILGMENQQKVDPTMPLRILIYDAWNYDRQMRSFFRKKREAKLKAETSIRKDISSQSESHPDQEREKDTPLLFSLDDEEQKLLKAQFLDVFRPVATIVVYWGTGKWTGPRTLQEMATWRYQNDPEKLAYWKKILNKMVNPYPLHILVPAEIKDKKFPSFTTRAGYLFWYLGHVGGRNWKKFEDGAKWAQQHWHPTDLEATTIEAVTHERLSRPEVQDENEEVDMYTIIREFRMQHEQEQKRLEDQLQQQDIQLQQQSAQRQALEDQLQQQDQTWVRLIEGIMREKHCTAEEALLSLPLSEEDRDRIRALF